MEKEFNEIISLFNENVDNFGNIDVKLMNDFTNNYRKLYYIFPIIEKLVRLLLDKLGYHDIENYSKSAFNTLNHIIEKNEEGLLKIIPPVEFKLLKIAYSPGGLRNSIMHYNKETTFHPNYVLAMQGLLFVLISTYVINFIEPNEK